MSSKDYIFFKKMLLFHNPTESWKTKKNAMSKLRGVNTLSPNDGVQPTFLPGHTNSLPVFHCNAQLTPSVPWQKDDQAKITRQKGESKKCFQERRGQLRKFRRNQVELLLQDIT